MPSLWAAATYLRTVILGKAGAHRDLPLAVPRLPTAEVRQWSPTRLPEWTKPLSPPPQHPGKPVHQSLQRHDPKVAFVSVAYRDSLVPYFRVPHYQHVGNLLHLIGPELMFVGIKQMGKARHPQGRKSRYAGRG